MKESEFVRDSLKIICTKHSVPSDTANSGTCPYKAEHFLSVPQRLLGRLRAFYLNSPRFYIFQRVLYEKEHSVNSLVSSGAV